MITTTIPLRAVGLLLLFACTNAQAREPDMPCTGAAHVRPWRDPPTSKSESVAVRVQLFERKTALGTLASATIGGALPPSIVDVGAALGDVLVAVHALQEQDVYGALDVRLTHSARGYDVSLTAVTPLQLSAPPPLASASRSQWARPLHPSMPR